MNPILVFYYYLKTKYKKFTTVASIQKHQDRQWKKQAKFLNHHSPFYRSWNRNHHKNIFDIKNYPNMDKTMMMEHFNTLNTVCIEKEKALEAAFKAEESRDFSPTINNITIGLSSGTSGNRGVFLVSPRERNQWAGIMLAKTLPKPIWQKQSIAFFLRANSNLYESVSSKSISFSFYDLLHPLDAHIEQLNRQQPDIIVAPPSMMRALAEKKNSEELMIQPIKIVTVAEVLDPIDKAYIEKMFDQVVHQIYQCTEGFLAATCSKGTLHLNEDLVLFEKKFVNDEKTKFHPVISDFTRTTQPIIRYELNDILTLKTEPCSCGSPMTAIEQIEGRSDDLFHGTDKQTGESKMIFPDFIRRAIIAASPDILAYRVVQEENRKWTIMISVDKTEELKAQKQVAESIENLMGQLDCEMPSISFSPYDICPGPAKLKRVECRFKSDR